MTSETSVQCPTCGSSNVTDAAFCQKCGSALPPSGEHLVRAIDASDGVAAVAKPSSADGRQINIVDASEGGTVAIGGQARAVNVSTGGTYIESQTVLQQRPRVEPNLFQVPFPRNDGIVGREEDLTHLHALLSGADHQPVGLHGLGGTGKTQLAIEYAYRYRTDFPDGIFWLNAADPSTWQAGFAAIAARLGLEVPDSDRVDTQMRLAGVLAANLNSHPHALLILDNIEDPTDLSVLNVPGFVPAALACRVLFTTRRRVADLPFVWREVGILPEDASLALLLHHESRRRVLDPAHPDHPAARELCRCLGYLPLTLALAGAFLARNLRVTVSGYLARIGKEGVLATVDRTHLRPEDLPTGHKPSIGATLRLQWGILTDTDARRVLQTASLLGEAEQIPRARLALLTGLPDTAQEGYASPLEDSLAVLRDLSLVEKLTSDEVRLHPLVREFAAGQITDRDAFIQAAVSSLVDALWDVERLEAEVRSRGVDAVISDLRKAHALAETYAGGNQQEGAEAGVVPLLRALDRESYVFCRWEPQVEPAFFLQQWRNRCFEWGWGQAVEQAESLLAARKLSYLRELRQVGTLDPSRVRSLEMLLTFCPFALSADGQCVVVASPDNVVEVRDLMTGQVIRMLGKHSDSINDITISSDSRLVLSASDDAMVMVCDLKTGQTVHNLCGHKSAVRKVAVMSDGSLAVSLSDDGIVVTWDLARGEAVQSWEGARQGFYEEGNGTRDETGQSSHELAHGYSIVESLPGTKLAILAAEDGALQLYDPVKGEIVRTFTDKFHCLSNIGVTADGRTVVAYGLDVDQRWYIGVWDVLTGHRVKKVLTAYQAGPKDYAFSLDVSADGRLACLLLLHPDKPWATSLQVWDLVSGQLTKTLAGLGVMIYARVAPSGDKAVSGSLLGPLEVWDLNRKLAFPCRMRHAGPVTSVTTALNRQIAVSASEDGTLLVWSQKGREAVRVLSGHTDVVCSAAITLDNRSVVSASKDKTLRVWNLETGRSSKTLLGHEGSVHGVALTSDGRLAVSTSEDKTVRVWDLSTGAVRGEQQVRTDHCFHWTPIAITPDDRLVACGSNDNHVVILRLDNMETVYTLVGHDGTVHGLTVTPDGRYVLSAGLDGLIKVWDLVSGRETSTLRARSGEVLQIWYDPIVASNACGLAVTHDSRFVASALWEDSLKVWALDSGKMVAHYDAGAMLCSCAFTPDDRLIVAGDALGGVHFLEWVRP